MSKMQPEEIVVDFNLIKQEIRHDVIEEVKPKAKRASKKNIVVSEDVNKPVEDVVEDVNPIEEVKVVKPKAKRTSKNNNTVDEEVKVVKPKAKRAIKNIIFLMRK